MRTFKKIVERPKIVITFDLEFWYNSKFLRNDLKKIAIGNLPDRVIEQTALILELLKTCDSKATFFVLGRVAEKYPDVVRKICDNGHEIASHGYSHTILQNLTPKLFEEEIQKTNEILESITNKKIIGFRAPAFSLNQKTSWAIPILEKSGFLYNSGLTSDLPGKSLIEAPVSTFKIFGLKIPCGGFYFRAMPYFLFKKLVNSFNKQLVILYFHPHEFDDKIPSYARGLNFIKKKIKYANAAGAFGKLERLLTDYQTVSIKERLENN